MKISATLALAALAATLAEAHPFYPRRAQEKRDTVTTTVVEYVPVYVTPGPEGFIDTSTIVKNLHLHEKRGGMIAKDKGERDLEIVTTTTVVIDYVYVTAPPEGFIGASTDMNIAAINTVPAPVEFSSTTPSVAPPAPATFTTVTTSSSPSVEAQSSSTTTSSTSSTSVEAPPSYSAQAALATSAAAPSTTEPAPQSSAAPPSSSSPAPQPTSVAGSGFGLAWSPYVPGGCKSSSQAASEFAQMQGYDYVRIYGTDCNQVSTAVQYASQYGMKIFAEIYDLTDVAAEAGTIISAVNGNWGIIDTISVGNEDVNNGVPVSTVTSAMAQAKSVLGAAGFTGNLVHVDTQNAFESNPSMCSPSVAGSYVAANIHPFFNPDTSADEAAQFVQTQIGMLQSCAGSVGSNRVRVTETGWPKQGSDDGAAVPSKANQDVVVAGIKALPAASDAIFLSSFDDTWKAPGPFGCEQFWGILDD